MIHQLAFWTSRILAIASSLACLIVWIMASLALFQNIASVSNYLLLAACVLTSVSVLFLFGTAVWRQSFSKAAYLLIAACLLWLITMAYPILGLFEYSLSWQGALLSCIISFLAAAPFIFLTVYLVRSIRKNANPLLV